MNKFGVKSIIIGLCWTFIEKKDTYVIDKLRNNYEHKIDLVALDMARMNDHGTGVLNHVRYSYGLKPYSSFEELTPDVKI